MTRKKIKRPDNGPLASAEPLVFSLKFLTSTDKFSLERCSQAFLLAVLREIQKYTGSAVCDFCNYDHERHSHRIDFPTTTEPDGFGLDEQLGTEDSWQFAVHPSLGWRVHGFFIDDTFFVVWLDEYHRLDPAWCA